MLALEAAQALFRAHENEQWLAVAHLMQPDELSAFRVQHRRMAEMAERFTQTIRSVGLVPPAGALSGRVNPVLRGFAGVSTLAQYDSLTPVELFARWLEARAPRPENYADGRGPIRTRTVMRDDVKNESTVDVVYRIHVDVGEFGETDRIERITARLEEGEWRFALNSDIGGVGVNMLNAVTLMDDEDEGSSAS